MSAASRRAPTLRELPINLDTFKRDAGQLFGAAERLQAYRTFLASARAMKASTATPAIDRQVRASAGDAATDVATACAAAARLIRVLHGTGGMQRMATDMASVVKAEGKTKVRELLRTSLSAKAKTMIRDVGVSDTLWNALQQVVESADIEVTRNGSTLQASGKIDGRPIQGRLETAPRPALPTSVVDLLTRQQFETRCAQVERGDPAYILGHGVEGDPRLEDLLLRDVLTAQREGVRHLRKLQDAGLATYAGGEPGTIALVGLIILAIGALVSIYYCDEDDETNGPEGGCAVGKALAFLGAAMLLLVGFPSGSGTGTTPQNATGTPLVHGPLPQLIGSAHE